MTELGPPALTAADAAFLEGCRHDLATRFEPRDAVEEVVRRLTTGGLVEPKARAVVRGRQGTFAAIGETVVEAYGQLCGMASR